MWRFQTPLRLRRPCRIVFAGPHFQAGLVYTRERFQAQQDRGRDDADNHHQLIWAKTKEELWQEIPTADIALPFMERFDAELIQCAKQLRLIIQFGVGLEGVNVEEATRQGIAVSNIPAHQTGNAQATSEHAIFLATTLLRRSQDELPRRFQNRELGGWPVPRSLYQKRVTVVGYGSVGSMLCQYLSIMGANVTAVRRNWDQGDDAATATTNIQKSTNLEQELPTTDLLILTCTLTPETFHMINESRLALLPHGALIVNVGRGPLVEYHALWQGLQSGQVGGFASDVGVGHDTKPSEPWDPTDPLSQHPRVYMTPHVGGYTDYSYGKMADTVVRAVDHVIQGQPPDVWVNQS